MPPPESTDVSQLFQAAIKDELANPRPRRPAGVTAIPIPPGHPLAEMIAKAMAAASGDGESADPAGIGRLEDDFRDIPPLMAAAIRRMVRSGQVPAHAA